MTEFSQLGLSPTTLQAVADTGYTTATPIQEQAIPVVLMTRDVLGVAHHSETEELLVVYRACYGERGLWVRPLAMFLENVLVDGHARPRFQLVAEHPGSPAR